MMFWNRFAVVLFCAFRFSDAVNIAITDTIDGHTISLSSEDDLETVLSQLKRFERISIQQSPLDNSEEHGTEPSEMSEENIGNAVLWYMTSSATILLLLLVCFLWCRCTSSKDRTDEVAQASVAADPAPISETAPPAYDLFAPPSYENFAPPSYETVGGGNPDFQSNSTDEESIDSWSIVWYVASFGGLITFFLVVSCSEWCCRKHVREQQTRRTQPASPPSPTPSFDVPPPAYDLFAPPSYDSLSYGGGSGEKNEFEVFVVPVHTLGGLTNTTSEQPPPSYSITNETMTTTTTTVAATATTTTTATPQRNSASVS